MPAAQSEQRALFIDVSYCLELFVFHFEVVFLFEIKLCFTRKQVVYIVSCSINQRSRGCNHMLCRNADNI